MPNSYTSIPGIVAGNLKVSGNVTVQGDNLVVGAAAPFARMGKAFDGSPMFSGNLGFDRTSFDTNAVGSFLLNYSLSNSNLSIIKGVNGGTLENLALPGAVSTDFTTHAHTGTTTLDTIVSKVISGGVISANGALFGRVLFQSTVQGALPTTVSIFLGAQNPVQFTITATGTFLLEWMLGNSNSQAVQNGYARCFNLSTGGIILGGLISGTVDTSVNQTLALKVTNGTNTDQQNWVVYFARLENSFGPV